VAVVGEVLAAAGKKSGAHDIIDELLRPSKTHHVSPYHIAAVYSALGEPDQAFAMLLENAWQSRDDALNWIVVDPAFDGIRSDPRYSDLVRRIGLPQ
jgi:predicted Zn-dependent protease